MNVRPSYSHKEIRILVSRVRGKLRVRVFVTWRDYTSLPTKCEGKRSVDLTGRERVTLYFR